MRAWFALPLVAIALQLGGCATGNLSTSVSTSLSGGDGKPPSAIRRCSPGDPDRHAWFCVIGQILYGIAGAMQPDGGYSLR